MSQVITLKRKIIYSIIAVLPIIILVIATELHLRHETAKWYEKKLSRNHALKNSLMIHRKSDDPLLIYELTPGAEVSRGGITYKINQAGFRDNEFPDPKSSPKKMDEYRIVVIGDSVAWGWGVEMDQAWPQLLEKNLQGHISGKRVSVYNLAVNGYATPQEVRVLATRGLEYQPDLVILNYVLNDPEVEDGGLSWYFEAVNRIEILYKGKFLFSFIYNAMKAKLGLAAEIPNNSVGDHYYLIHHSDLFENVERGFADLAVLARQQKIPVLVIVTPVFEYRKNEPYPWAGIHQQIQSLADKNQFMFLDTQQALSHMNGQEISFDAIHPNAEGHKIIAAAVLEKLSAIP